MSSNGLPHKRWSHVSAGGFTGISRFLRQLYRRFQTRARNGFGLPHSQPCVSVSPYWWCDTGKLKGRQKVTDGTETRPLAISSRDPRDVQAEQVRRAGEE